jgi:hypothetical protein
MWAYLLAPDRGFMDLGRAPYTIRIQGHLGPNVLFAFPDLVLHCHGTQTVLTGSLDQSALYGVLAEIEALGLGLIEVRRLASRSESPGAGDIISP